MRKTLMLISILLVSFVLAHAQDKPQAYKFGEFGDLQESEWKQKLDTFSKMLISLPDAKLHIIVYAESGKSLTSIEDTITQYRNYLYKTKNIEWEKFIINRAGFRNSQTTELWIVPKDANDPVSTPAEEFKAEKFAEYKGFSDSQLDELVNKLQNSLKKNSFIVGYVLIYGEISKVKSESKRFENKIRRCGYDGAGCQIMFVEVDASDFRTVIWLVPRGTEPPIPDATAVKPYPKAFVFDDFDKVSEAYYMHSFFGYFEKLIKDKNSKGVVINYFGNKDKQTHYLDLMKANVKKHYLFTENNLQDRITFIESGVGKSQLAELWIVPLGAELPKLKSIEDFYEKPITSAQPSKKAEQIEMFEPYIFSELEKADDEKVEGKMREFFEKILEEGNAEGYIITYGNSTQIEKREKQLMDSIYWRDGPSFTFVSVENSNLKTVLWIIPKNGSRPKP